MSTVPTGQPIALPAFDNTLGALYIGSIIATALYGVICLQTFLYITSNRTRSDSWRMKLLVSVLFRSGLDTAHQCLMLAGMYRFLITDYANPAALPTGGSRSGEALTTYEEGIIGVCSILLVQLFFCWRIWTFSASSLHTHVRIAFIAIAVSLALLNFASYVALSIFGYRHRLLTENTPDFTASHSHY
ncbi:uncharacterized protein EV420DRAFT_1634532 [Desarmillaria tabescens]|uniref:Uncharacterized protein n=1 Tax=Armillaria tabescens TaxID=1929756 RepID=A0AA39NQP9_ARMTA|nr:uncharacterized protein EV420DRAFT_1634532 [Desarmillaria tabescens]KAK0470107.1 hypothetical protein EV420DRAFT_1634532 [Desarmillaria tabescens]